MMLRRGKGMCPYSLFSTPSYAPLPAGERDGVRGNEFLRHDIRKK